MIEKDFLEKRYIEEKKSIKMIAKELNRSEQYVFYYIKKYNIKTRTISEATKGRKIPEHHREQAIRNLLNANIKKSIEGVSEEEETRLKEIRKLRKNNNHSDETKEKLRIVSIGRKNSEESKKKMSETRKNNPEYSGINHPLYGKSRNDIKGENNPNWNGGTTNKYKNYRKTTKYIIWRTDCFKRDNYTCQFCGNYGGELHVDHIKPFALILKENNIQTIEDLYNCEELWDMNNGRTLCIDCHKKTNTYGSHTKEMLKLITSRKE